MKVILIVTSILLAANGMHSYSVSFAPDGSETSSAIVACIRPEKGKKVFRCMDLKKLLAFKAAGEEGLAPPPVDFSLPDDYKEL